MTGAARSERERLLDLLADEALGSLEASDRSELDFLLKRHRDVPRNALAESVALADLAIATMEHGEGLPPALRERIRSTYRSPLARTGAPPRSPGLRRIYALVYLAAAAIVVTAFLLLLKVPPAPSGEAEYAHQKVEVDRLTQRASDLTRWNWKSGPDPKGTGSAVNGEVLWSSTEQRGFMVFHGLAHNDKKAEQYQLWIFDKARDDRYPVDGGVFDCVASDAIVPITAKVGVTEPVLFAVTVEKPGGVVVSDRSRIAALAQP